MQHLKVGRRFAQAAFAVESTSLVARNLSRKRWLQAQRQQPAAGFVSAAVSRTIIAGDLGCILSKSAKQ